MNATAINRMLAYKRRLLILELLQGKKLTTFEVAEHISDNLNVIKEDLKRLYLMRHLSRERKFHPVRNAYVFAYTTKNKNLPMPNVIITDKQKKHIESADFENGFKREKKADLPLQKTPHKKVVVDPNNPNITTYFNLNRAGSDYAWQRKKHKTNVSIGSTFSLYDGATL